jgi:hypothetical protein
MIDVGIMLNQIPKAIPTNKNILTRKLNILIEGLIAPFKPIRNIFLNQQYEK